MLENNDTGNGMVHDPAGTVEPLVIQENDHPIRLQDLDKEALKVLYRLRDAGHAGYLVGGGVRDLYLGKQPKDFDISTDARPGQIRKLFRNSRTIGRRFRLVQVYFRGGKIIEVSTLRSQSEFDLDGPDKVLPSNNTFGTLSEDACRRDLTINSLFYEIENRTIIDYVGGVKDLDQGVIRIVGAPDRRVTRDPVRIMRAVRHAARNGFRIEPQTWKAIVENRDKLSLCPPSRIRDEILKDLQGGTSESWLDIALKSRIFFTLFPFYEELLFSSAGKEHREFLLALFRAIDRLRALSIQKGYSLDLPDHFLLALLLLPWALDKYDLLQARQKGQAFFTLAREIRSGIDMAFSEGFNLKRMSKEAIVSLLINLSTFELYYRKRKWPKWLRRKSYFRDCFRFYRLLVEAKEQRLADDKLFIVEYKGTGEHGEYSNNMSRSKNMYGGRRSVRPAFTHRGKGVFGLRKR